MKVLCITPAFYPAVRYGGIVPSTYGVYRALGGMGVKTRVLTTDAFDGTTRNRHLHPKFDGLEVRCFRNISNHLAWNRLMLAPGMIPAILRSIHEFDLVHIIDFRFFAVPISLAVARRGAVPVVITPLDPMKPYARKTSIKRMYDDLWGKRVLRESDAVIAQGELEARSYLSLGIAESRIHLIPNGVDLNRPVIPGDGAGSGLLRRRLSIPREAVLVLYLGRIDHVKGVDLLVDAFSLLVNSDRIGRDVYLVLAGPDSGYLEPVANLVKKSGLTGRVLFAGPIWEEEKWQALSDADLCVFPSRYEEFGIAPLEAYLSGTPVIVTSMFGVNHWMRDRFEEVVLPNVSDIADAIEDHTTVVQAISESEIAERERVVSENFSYGSVARQMHELFRSAIR